MIQLLILSGKGGTGKTTVAGAFIKLSHAKAYADCDVDAPNLHMVMHQTTEPMKTDYDGFPKAAIDPDHCGRCGLCRQHCRFDAISVGPVFKVDPYACEGCGVCEMVCPWDAITLTPTVAGELKLYTDDAIFSTAQLKMGSGTSGKLVTEVKKQLYGAAKDAEIAIIDGSPGIGCPVIASISGMDMVLIVAEPSMSGISDMERIIQTAEKFHTRIAVCTNKYDTNLENAESIETFCTMRKLPFVGGIPYDPDAVKAINNAQSIVDIDCAAGRAAKAVYDETMKTLYCPAAE